MDLFGPSRTTSLGGKSYAFVIVDDFSRYTWVLFLAHKNDVFDAQAPVFTRVHEASIGLQWLMIYKHDHTFLKNQPLVHG